MDIDHVSVVLSTTKHSITCSSDKLVKLDVPICVAVIKLDTPIQKTKRQILKYSCRELSEFVHIDPEKKTVWVGLKI